MTNTIALILGIYGSALSTIIATLSAYKAWQDRRRLQLVSFMSELTIGDETTRKALLVMITSVGRRPVYVVDWGIRDKQGNRIGDPEKESILRLANQPPTALKEGEYVVVGTSDLSILPDAQQIYARDSTGKEWKVARRHLKKIRK